MTLQASIQLPNYPSIWALYFSAQFGRFFTAFDPRFDGFSGVDVGPIGFTPQAPIGFACPVGARAYWPEFDALRATA